MNKRVYLLIGLCLLLTGVELYAQAITRGPYLQSGTPNSMVIRWRTNTATSTRVWYGLSPSNLAFTNTVNGTRTNHEVKISGLAPNSTYYYAVGNTTGQLMTPTANHYFRTSPTPGATQTIRAWVLGDCGTGDDNQRDVRDAFYDFFGSGPLDMILLLGDNAYEDGTDSEFQDALFENMYEERLINTVMWPAIGNHETATASSADQSGPYYDIFTMPTNGEAGGLPSGTEAYYSFDYGNIHFVVLDSDDTEPHPGDPMYEWLEADLAATTQDWKVAYFHHPPYSKDDSDDNHTETEIREIILPLLEANGVDLVLTGHSHNWQRSYFIHGHYGYSSSWNPAAMGLDLGDGRLDGDGAYTKDAGPNVPGTVYIVSGSAGKRSGTVTHPHPVMYYSAADHGSMYLEVTGDQMDIKFLRETGAIDDYLTIIKNGAIGSPPTVSITAPAHGANYTAAQQVLITANAMDSDGSITQVAFFINGLSIGVDNQAPYSANYTIPGQGTYDILAIAEDNDGNTTPSDIVQFTMGPVNVCSRISAGSDDAEERESGSVNLTSGDLELVAEPGQGNQVIGLRFNNLNIPQGITITSAYLQFTADENVNDNPCNLTIYGEASNNAATFTSANKNVSGRPRTSASAVWSPTDWLSPGDNGMAQQSLDISLIIQEIVSRPGFSANSSIALIIEGTGRRVAESFDGDADDAVQLCIQYTTAPPDCPDIPANIGAPCNDGDNTTLDDRIDGNCNCVGTPTACTGIGDADGDGVCADLDCDDNDPNITHRPGDACDDGYLGTINDVYDANCNCAGVLNDCPGIGDNDGDGVCADIDCNDNDPNAISIAGDPCDDGDNTTLDDTYDGNCNCVGTPTACTGIGDADNDGICADVDCDDNDPNITHQPGDACDDNDPATINDVYDANCNCAGILNDCPGIGDSDGDGLCSDVDCDDNNPNIISQAGGPCDDGDNTTIDDTYDGNCNCVGIPTACTGIGDNDGDGVCADVDCNDFDPNITSQPGDACDDGNPATIGETIQPDCSCGGGSAGSNYTCVQISAGSDDAEERDSGPTDIGNSDLELVDDRSRGLQTVGMRFTGLNIPQGATITNAYIQFTVDENRNLNPCELSISGEAADNPPGFINLNNNISSRPRTAATVQWLPQEWLVIGGAAAAQRTPDLSGIIQEIVNRSGYTAGSAMVFIIEGIGARVAESFEGGADKAAQLCVAYSSTPYDCPALSAFIGDICNDGDPTTVNDRVDANCNCVGTPTACTGIGDADGDGLCSDVDCNDNDPNIAYQAGDACDDGDNTTINDIVDGNCNCAGTPTACTGIGDADGDGLCADVDCDDNNAGITSTDADGDGVCTDVDCDDSDPNIAYQPGDPCEDGNPGTFGETIQSDCNCGGGTEIPTSSCSTISNGSDDAEERLSGSVNLTSNDLELVTDRDPQSVGLRFTGLNIPQGAFIANAYIQFQVDEAVNDNPCNLVITGQASDDAPTFTTSRNGISSRPRTGSSVAWSPPQWQAVGNAGPAQQTPDLSAILQEIVDRAGYTDASSIVLIIEGSGRRTAESAESPSGAPQLCVDYFFTPPPFDCPGLSAYYGDACDDGDNTTLDDVVDANCNCAGTPTACTGIGDADGDGLCADVDCDDDDPAITTQPGMACDDGNPATINDMIDANCNCAGTLNDCPGIGDADGDGICADVDCNDNDPALTAQLGEPCDDGNPDTFGETIQADCSCGGGTMLPTSVCSFINSSTDDAEQESLSGRMDLNSSDLELCTDGASQWVGLRFNNLNIPPGANIISAYIQFEVDETGNDDPCNLTIYGQASDNAITFTGADFDLSGRPRTGSSVAWSPARWLAVGDAGAAQQTPGLSAILQEIVNRSGYTDASSVAFLIEGTGRRVAESFDGPAGGPQLCVEYFATPPDYDCPDLSAFTGDSCDDGDNTTLDDVVDGNCNCQGTPTACTGIGDADGDGICDDVDCGDDDAAVTTQPGDACDDGNPATINDMIDANCNCTGTLNDCPGIGDDDGDGICADVDCNDNDPAITAQAGDACDDGDPNTVGEIIQADCSCGGGISAPTLSCAIVSASSDDAEEQAGPADLTSSDLELATDPNLGLQTVGLRFNNLNIPRGAVITNAYVQFTVDEAENDNPCNLTIYGQASDNAPTFVSQINNIKGRARTAATVSWTPPSWLTVGAAGPEQQTPNLAAIIQEIVDRSGYTAASSIVFIIDGSGRRTAESANGPPGLAPELCVEYLYAGDAMQMARTPGANERLENRSQGQGADSRPTQGASPISVHPNPATDKLLVTFTSDIDGQARVQVRSLSGSIVLSDVQEARKGENTIALQGLSLPGGIYFLQLFTGDTAQSAKFVIQKD